MIPSGQEEERLVQQSRQGDLESFNRLVELYQQAVYNLALRMLGDTGEAEDATQDTFLLAFKGINKFRGGNFKAWIFRIAANVCRDRLRARKRKPTLSLDSLESPGFSSLSSQSESPEDWAMREELGQVIQQGLASLNEKQRLVVILSDIQGFSYEEIAQITGSSLGTVKSRLNRGRRHLRDYLLQHKELLPPGFVFKVEGHV